jgi:23S rRNA pseudouridine1911/1915/1917 synthase
MSQALTPAISPKYLPNIFYEDTHLIVLSKPAGLLSQGEIQGDPNLVDWARAHVGRNYVGLVHRLDRNTSGVMVLAKRTKSAQRLTDALQKGTLTRAYQAWLIGKMPDLGKTRRWSHSLFKDEKKNLVRVVSSSHPGAKSAVLSVTPVAYGVYEGKELTLAEFVLETGRSHQIRAQASAEGFPLLGDIKYGERANAGVRFPRPALHSIRIAFDHPMSRERLTFEDTLPEDMRSIKPLR